MDETYEAPRHGWTCFFCGDTFTTVGSARDHFGADQLGDPGCRIKAGGEKGLLMALRQAEQRIARYLAEDSEALRCVADTARRHSDQLRDAEQAGYDKGLGDGGRLVVEKTEIPDAHVELVARAIEPQTFELPRINLYSADYERARATAAAAIAAYRRALLDPQA